MSADGAIDNNALHSVASSGSSATTRVPNTRVWREVPTVLLDRVENEREAIHQLAHITEADKTTGQKCEALLTVLEQDCCTAVADTDRRGGGGTSRRPLGQEHSTPSVPVSSHASTPYYDPLILAHAGRDEDDDVMAALSSAPSAGSTGVSAPSASPADATTLARRPEHVQVATLAGAAGTAMHSVPVLHTHYRNVAASDPVGHQTTPSALPEDGHFLGTPSQRPVLASDESRSTPDGFTDEPILLLQVWTPHHLQNRPWQQVNSRILAREVKQVVAQAWQRSVTRALQHIERLVRGAQGARTEPPPVAVEGDDPFSSSSRQLPVHVDAIQLARVGSADFAAPNSSRDSQLSGGASVNDDAGVPPAHGLVENRLADK